MMIPEKELLPFDTQIAPVAVLMSKGRDKFRAKSHRSHRRQFPEKQPLPFDTQIAQKADSVSNGRDGRTRLEENLNKSFNQ
jgi:hypothetical protein